MKTLMELNKRYTDFCLKNDLEDSLKPDEQYQLSDGQQCWVDAHISRVTEAKLRDATLIQEAVAGDSVNKKDDSKTPLFSDFDMTEGIGYYDEDAARIGIVYS
jgi:ribosome assembly protein YihI (activator of Der GTPase)